MLSEQPARQSPSLDRPGGGAGGPQALPSSWAHLDQEPDLGERDKGMGRCWWGRTATLAASFVGFLFCFSFLKKKKNPRWSSRGRFVAIAMLPEGGEFRRSVLAGARAASSWRKAHCAVLGLGAGGRCFPSLVYSAQNRWPVMQDVGREGVPREPLGPRKSESPIL